VVTPFARLARVHVLSAGGDALIALALAGSLFFNLEPDAARPRVALYLLLTIAPFAIVGPLIGPLVDRARGGRRTMVMVTAIGRLVVAVLMMRHLDSLLLFPEAFAAMVLGKTYHVSKSAIVPGLVHADTELVKANSRLVLLSGVGGGLAILPGILLGLLGGPNWTLALAAVLFGVMLPVATKLPKATVATEPADAQERQELRGAGIVLAASAMAVLRGMVGFVMFLIAFWLRESGAATIWFGLMFVASSIGALIGAVSAPFARRLVREEHLLGGGLALTALVSLVVAVSPDRATVSLVVGTVGLASSLGKLSFDAIVQRDAPAANRGRSFARFESRFQLFWVLGALVPVLAPIAILRIHVGLVILAIVSAVSCFLYTGGLFAVARGRRTPGQMLVSRIWTVERYGRLEKKLPRWLLRLVPLPVEPPQPKGESPPEGL
jgi:hypothetical protein